MHGVRLTKSSGGVLSFDLRDILRVLGHRATSSWWTAAGVPEVDEPPMWFGPRADQLDALAASGRRVRGNDLQGIADGVLQVIWGLFEGFDLSSGGTPWVRITAFDSTWFDVQCSDNVLVERLREAFAANPIAGDGAWLRLGDISTEDKGTSLLVWGSEDGLLCFRDFLRRLSPSQGWRSLDDIPSFASSDGMRLVVGVTTVGLTSLQKLESGRPGTWQWSICPTQLPSFVERVEVVASSVGQGHHYLDSDEPAGGTVIVSKGEYPDNFRP